MSKPTVAGISLILESNEEVDQAAELLRAVGLDVAGGDGYVEVNGPSLSLSVMRGTMIDVPRHGGLLLQIKVADVDAAATAAKEAGAIIALGPVADESGGYGAFVQSQAGFTIELQADELG